MEQRRKEIALKEAQIMQDIRDKADERDAIAQAKHEQQTAMKLEELRLREEQRMLKHRKMTEELEAYNRQMEAETTRKREEMAYKDALR